MEDLEAEMAADKAFANGRRIEAARAVDRRSSGPRRVLESHPTSERHASPRPAVELDEPRHTPIIAQDLEHEHALPGSSVDEPRGRGDEIVGNRRGDASARAGALRVDHSNPSVGAPRVDSSHICNPEQAFARPTEQRLRDQRRIVELLEYPVEFGVVGTHRAPGSLQSAPALFDRVCRPQKERVRHFSICTDLSGSAELSRGDRESRVPRLLDLETLVERNPDVAPLRRADHSVANVDLARQPEGLIVQRQEHARTTLYDRPLEIRKGSVDIVLRCVDGNDLDVATPT